MMVWYSQLVKHFSVCYDLHTAKGFIVVNETEADFFSGIPLLSL